MIVFGEEDVEDVDSSPSILTPMTSSCQSSQAIPAASMVCCCGLVDSNEDGMEVMSEAEPSEWGEEEYYLLVMEDVRGEAERRRAEEEERRRVEEARAIVTERLRRVVRSQQTPASKHAAARRPTLCLRQPAKAAAVPATATEEFASGLTLTCDGVKDWAGNSIGQLMSSSALPAPTTWEPLAPAHGVYRTEEKVIKLLSIGTSDQPVLRENVEREVRHLTWCHDVGADLCPYILPTEAAFLVNHGMVERLLPAQQCHHSLSPPRTVALVFPFDPGLKDLLHLFPRHRPLAQMPEGLRMAAEELLAVVFYKVVCALVVLHAHNIVHHDLKVDQVLMSQHDVRLCDFGSSTVRCNPATECHTVCHPKITSPLHYGAQEDWTGSIEVRCCPKFDVWSLGATLLEMTTGQFVFSDDWAQLRCRRRPEAELHAIVQESPLSADLTAFIMTCLQDSIDARPTSASLLAQPYLLPYADYGLHGLRQLQACRVDKFLALSNHYA